MSTPKRALAVLLFTSAIPLGVGRAEPADASTGKITATPDPITIAEGEQATIAVHLTQPIIFPNLDDPRTSTITFTSDDPSRVAVSSEPIVYEPEEWWQERTLLITVATNDVHDTSDTVVVRGVITTAAPYYQNAAVSVQVHIVDDDPVPEAPTNVSAEAGRGRARVSFDPADGHGKAVTGYTVTAQPGGHQATGTTAPITLDGLTGGVVYSFTVTATTAAGSSAPSAMSNAVTPESTNGYWMIDDAGSVTGFGPVTAHAPTNSLGALAIVGAPNADAYWTVAPDGSVTAYGGATTFVAPVVPTGERVVAMAAATPPSSGSATGAWLFTDRGRVLPLGTATSYGDLTTITLKGPIVDAVATSDGRGYYLVASDGGVFAFGNATFRGSMGGSILNQPVVSIAVDDFGDGYWLIASDGGVFAFGVPFRGSMGGVPLVSAVVDAAPYGDGYLLVAGDGGAFVFSSEPFRGSLSGLSARPVVDLAVLHSSTAV
ncbi:MAG: fibronectin type III domain-containing protein [Acidimicrobiia bacterium]